jgi:hypothetical protein
LGSAKRVAQFLNVGHPDALKSLPQFNIRHRFVLQKELDVGEVFRVRAPHHLGEYEIKVRRSKQLQMCKWVWNAQAARQPIGPKKYIRLGEQVRDVEAEFRQFRVRGVASLPELGIRAQWVELGQRDDCIHVLGRLVPGCVGRKTQRERGPSVKRQLHRVIEVAVQRLQDGERIIHDA